MKLRVDARVSHLKPGLTGWAQINGRDHISLEEKVALEKEYLEKKTVILDIKIILSPFSSAFFRNEGISH